MEVHIKEREEESKDFRGNRYRRFDCWAVGEAVDLLDAMAIASYKPPFSKRLEAVDPDDVQRFALMLERLVWRWNLAAKANNAGEIKIEKFLDLKF